MKDSFLRLNHEALQKNFTLSIISSTDYVEGMAKYQTRLVLPIKLGFGQYCNWQSFFFSLEVQILYIKRLATVFYQGKVIATNFLSFFKIIEIWSFFYYSPHASLMCIINFWLIPGHLLNKILFSINFFQKLKFCISLRIFIGLDFQRKVHCIMNSGNL